MAKKQIFNWIKKSTDQLKDLKARVDKLKEEQAQLQTEVKDPKKPKSQKKEEVVMHISGSSVARAALIVIGLYFLTQFVTQIWSIIVVFFVSILFAAALDPTVDALEKRKIPRWLSVIVIFILLIALLAFFISQLIPLIAVQLIELAKSLTQFINTAASGGDFPFSEQLQPILDEVFKQVDKETVIEQIKNSLENAGSQLQDLAGNTFGAIKTIFNGVFNFFLVLVLTFFLVVDEKGVDEFFISLFPSKHGKYIVEKMEAVKHKVGFWLRGQIVLMVVMFTLTLVVFFAFGVDYALTLAMMAGIAELIPVIGPLLAGVPAVLVAFNSSPWLAIWIFVMIIVLQQLEGNVIVPIVMKKAVGLNPIIVILAMLMGYALLGILGMIIAVPVATALSIFVNDYAAKKK